MVRVQWKSTIESPLTLFLETRKAHVHTCSSGETSDAGLLLEVGAFDLDLHFKVSISSKVRALEVTTFT